MPNIIPVYGYPNTFAAGVNPAVGLPQALPFQQGQIGQAGSPSAINEKAMLAMISQILCQLLMVVMQQVLAQQASPKGAPTASSTQPAQPKQQQPAVTSLPASRFPSASSSPASAPPIVMHNPAASTGAATATTTPWNRQQSLESPRSSASTDKASRLAQGHVNTVLSGKGQAELNAVANRYGETFDPKVGGFCSAAVQMGLRDTLGISCGIGDAWVYGNTLRNSGQFQVINAPNSKSLPAGAIMVWPIDPKANTINPKTGLIENRDYGHISVKIDDQTECSDIKRPLGFRGEPAFALIPK